MLNHAIANSPSRDRILEILALPRERKTPEQVEFIYEEMKRCGSIDRGWNLARSLAERADNIFESLDFLQSERRFGTRGKPKPRTAIYLSLLWESLFVIS